MGRNYCHAWASCIQQGRTWKGNCWVEWWNNGEGGRRGNGEYLIGKGSCDWCSVHIWWGSLLKILRNLEILGNFIKDLLEKSSGDMTGAAAAGNSKRLPYILWTLKVPLVDCGELEGWTIQCVMPRVCTQPGIVCGKYFFSYLLLIFIFNFYYELMVYLLFSLRLSRVTIIIIFIFDIQYLFMWSTVSPWVLVGSIRIGMSL